MILKNDQMRKGALDALQILLTSKTRPVHSTTSDDESAQSQLKMPKNTTFQSQPTDQQEQQLDDDQKTRAQKIVDISDQELHDMQVERDLRNVDREAAIKAKNDADMRKATAQRIKKARSSGRAASFQDLLIDIKQALASQISQTRKTKDSYSRPNATYAGSELLMPGRNVSKQKNVPVIDVYMDQSGSFGDADIEKCQECLGDLEILERRKQIKINRYYFADDVHTTPAQARAQAGTRAFPKILDNITRTKPTNVLIMSDGDLDRLLYRVAGHNIVTVPGCVWWLWRGSRSPEAKKYLVGKKENIEYTLQ